MKLTVLITCFNEKATIAKAIEEAKALAIDKEVIVIDNCSTDGTREILKTFNEPGLKIVLQSRNFGVGRSVLRGIELARGDYFYSPCADLEYKMSDVFKMFDKLEEDKLDVVFGSRLLEKKNIRRTTLIKERPFWLGTIIATYLINKFYAKNFSDVIAPKLIRTEILKGLPIKSGGQAIEFEFASKLCKKRYKIGEVPIYYKPRSHKEGKTIRVFDMIPALFVMLKVKLFG